jgi:uncharacterized membrane protein YgcG
MIRPSFFRDCLFHFTFLLLLQICAAHVAHAESRVALVIGQSAYRAVPALPNAANDGKRMAELLGNAGFDVTAAPDLAQNDMRQTISDFAAKVAAGGPDTIALVFYAGHGLQIDGENYLVPVDVDPKREGDIPLQAVRLNDLMNTLAALPTRMRILMLDACRNNPFPAINKTAGHGLAIIDTKSGASGWFISFSTSPGAEAEDGNGDNSPYTTAVLSVVKEPNLPIEEAFKRVRVAVNQTTDGRQVPWESSSLTADFRFFGGDKDPGHSMAGPKPTAARSVADWRKDLAGKEPKVAYDLVIADDSVAGYEVFTALYAQSPYTPRMRSLLDRRREMLAWQTAVATDTASSFDAFLASYGSSDLAATAHKMEERVRNRSLGASAALMQPTNVALGPTCPCSVAPPKAPALKKVEPEPRTRNVEKRHHEKKYVEETPPRRKRPAVYYEEEVEESAPPPSDPRPVAVGGGMGGGFGGFGGGGYGGGGGGRGGGGHR